MSLFLMLIVDHYISIARFTQQITIYVIIIIKQIWNN